MTVLCCSLVKSENTKITGNYLIPLSTRHFEKQNIVVVFWESLFKTCYSGNQKYRASYRSAKYSLVILVKASMQINSETILQSFIALFCEVLHAC